MSATSPPSFPPPFDRRLAQATTGLCSIPLSLPFFSDPISFCLAMTAIPALASLGAYSPRVAADHGRFGTLQPAILCSQPCFRGALPLFAAKVPRPPPVRRTRSADSSSLYRVLAGAARDSLFLGLFFLAPEEESYLSGQPEVCFSSFFSLSGVSVPRFASHSL